MLDHRTAAKLDMERLTKSLELLAEEPLKSPFSIVAGRGIQSHGRDRSYSQEKRGVIGPRRVSSSLQVKVFEGMQVPAGSEDSVQARRTRWIYISASTMTTGSCATFASQEKATVKLAITTLYALGFWTALERRRKKRPVGMVDG